MTTFTSAILILHICAGSVALISGILALGYSLRPAVHRIVGKLFFYVMLIVFLTAIYLSLAASIAFLFAVAILAFYATFHGVRSMQFWKGRSKNWRDWFAVITLSVAGIYLSGKGLYFATSNMGFNVVLHLVFGGFMLLLSFNSANDLHRLPLKDVRWFKSHRSNMGGALIATITAFCTTTLDFLPAIVAWLGPSIILSPLLSLLIRKTNKHFNIVTS